jgi:hypothetical protein
MYIMLVLHPHHKLKYFKAAGWDEEWIDTAKKLIRDQFESRYASRTVTTESTNTANSIENVPKESSKIRDSITFVFIPI